MRQKWMKIKLVSLCMTALSSHAICAGERSTAEAVPQTPTIQQMGVTVTDGRMELRCAISNDTSHPIWVYAQAPDREDVNGARGTNAALFAGEDDVTLLVLRRMNSPLSGVMGERVAARYVRLSPGQSRAEVFCVILPFVVIPPRSDWKLILAIEERARTISRLTFELGYYTDDDLHCEESRSPRSRVVFDKSGQSVRIEDYLEDGIWTRERAIRMSLDGIRASLNRWLSCWRDTTGYHASEMTVRALRHTFYVNRRVLSAEDLWYGETLLQVDPNLFDDRARRVAGIYIRLAEGDLDPNELTTCLDRALAKNERMGMLRELYRQQALAQIPQSPLTTPAQAVGELFCGFAIDAHTYGYARRLFEISEDLLTPEAREIRRAYLALFEMRLRPNELPEKLDRIMNTEERDRLLDELLTK
jgi:hypothetical protein